MKNYYLFCSIAHYPRGGMWDYEGVYASIEEAQTKFGQLQNQSLEEYAAYQKPEPEWYQVVDSETMEVVAAEGYSCYGDPEVFAEQIEKNKSK